MRTLLYFVLFNFLVGCVSYESAIPKDFTGELATVSDTYSNKTATSAHFFYIKEIDNKSIANAARRTEGATYGKGANLIAVGHSRKVPMEKLALKVVGEVVRASPILYLLNPNENYLIEGEIEFTPVKDEFYFVKGELGEDYSSVWVEDIHGNIISRFDKGNKVNGGVNVAQAVEGEVVSDRSVLNKNVKIDDLSNINLGESSDLVKMRLGEPSDTYVIEGNFFKGTRDKTVFVYENIGQIVFSHGLKFIKIATVAELIPVVGGSEDNLEIIRVQMSSKDPKEIRAYAKEYYKSDYIYSDALEIISNKITEELNHLTGNNTDAVAWLLRVVGKSKNPSYIEFLRGISATTTSTKIKRYADKMIKELGEVKES